MLSNMHWEHVEVVKGGSVYPVKTGKHTVGFAFFYRVNCSDKKRKVVTGCSNEELREKAVMFLNKIEKECVEAEMAAKGINLETLAPKELTFADVSNEWFINVYAEKRKQDEISYSSLESRMHSLQAINNVIGSKLIAEIDDNVAKELIRRCSVKSTGQFYSESHVDKLQQAFRMVMDYAVEKGYCLRVPKKVKLSDNLTKVDKDNRFLEEEELADLLMIVEKNRRYKTVVHLMLTSGLRQEEVFALNIKDFRVKKDKTVEININKTVVKYEKNYYKIVYKTKNAGGVRKVYIPYNIYQMVEEYYNYVIDKETEFQSYLRSLYGYDGYIFLNKDIRPINKNTFETNFKNYLKRNGKDNLNFDMTLHMLRHCFVSFQAENLPLHDIAEIIGDSYKTTHEIYKSMTKKTKNKVCTITSDYYNRVYNKN